MCSQDGFPFECITMSLQRRTYAGSWWNFMFFYVPEGSWNYKLNTISIKVINNFISAGFIRVSPQLTLRALRERLGEFLGVDAVAENFLFLKCIGNSLAVVKGKQDSELKRKSFAPPYALQQELYLLPVIDHLGNVYSATTVNLDEQQSLNDTVEIDGTSHRPDSVSLSKDGPGDPSGWKIRGETSQMRKKLRKVNLHSSTLGIPGCQDHWKSQMIILGT